MKPRILFISTYPELTRTAGRIAEELDIPMTIHEGGIMKNGHLYAQNMEGFYDVIISQGGTAAAIKSIVSIPVVDIEIGITDFLNALLQAKEFGNTIGIVSYKSEMLHNLEKVKSALNIDFKVFPYSDRNELKRQIEEAVALEKLTLVGMGSCVMEAAGSRNIKVVMIETHVKAIRQAIISARNICDFGRREKEKAEWLKTVIDFSGEGIIALDKDGIITTFSPAASKLLNLKQEKAIGYPVSGYDADHPFRLLYGDGSNEIGKLLRMDNIQVIANRVIIVVDNEPAGTIITFQDVTKLQRLEQKVRTQLYNKGLVARYTFKDIVGSSMIMKDTIQKAERYAKSATTILIEGETGSGKELFAQSIHNVSSRKEGPFVAINCAALPESLLESELFGYEEGAFTGAKKGGKPGLFELAHKGTIFLDEIGEMPLSLQSRLLRVLQEKEVLRIGGDYILNVDVRIIAATNCNLYKMVREGKFREDLYYRISILNLRLPALRERKEDIPLIVRFLMGRLSREHQSGVKEICEEGMNALKAYSWLGNVRELENFIERVIILSNQPTVPFSFIQELLSEHFYGIQGEAPLQENEDAGTIPVKLGPLKDMELQLIRAVGSMLKDDKSLLAEKLGISRTTLWKRLKELEDSTTECS